MNFRQKARNFRPALSYRLYEAFEPQQQIEDLPEACLIHVHLPGFQMENVKLTYVAASRTMKATGQRQIQGTKWQGFEQSYLIPDYCEPEKVKANFKTPLLTLTMPKKATSQEKGVEAEPKLDEKLQDDTTTPPSTTTTKVEEPIQGKKSVSPQPKTNLEDTPSQTPSEPIKGRKGQEEAVERVGPSGENQMGEKELEAKPTPTRAASLHGDEKIQKGQEEIESKPTPTVPTKMERDEKPQKGQEEFEPKATSTMAPNIKTDEQPPKGQEEDKPKPDMTNVTRKTTVKEQLEEEKTEEKRDEEKERFTKEVKEEPSKSRKSVKDKELADFGEKETKTEKMLAKEAETSAPKVQKEKKKQSNNKTSVKKKLKSEGNAMERVGFVSHVFTKFAEWTLNKEEKKLAAKIGAAVLVIAALGYYVSYRFA